MPELITPAEYARRRPCHHTAVLKAIKTGRISLIDGKIDPEVANIQWDKNTRPRTQKPQPSPAAPPVDWKLENIGMWITLTRNRSMVPAATRAWLELATGAPADPRLVHSLTGLLQEIAGCVERITNPEPDEESDPFNCTVMVDSE